MKPNSLFSSPQVAFFSLPGSILIAFWISLLIGPGKPESPALDLQNPVFDFEELPDTSISICDPLFCIEFDNLDKGDFIDSVSTRFGPVYVNATNPGNQPERNAAMVFDTREPTGGDEDLGTPNQDFTFVDPISGNTLPGPGVGVAGKADSKFRNDNFRGNVMIITEDFDSEDPDDNAGGGTMVFRFDSIGPIILHSISFVDGEDVIQVFINNSNVPVETSVVGDNGYQTLDLGGVSNVTQVVIQSGGSFSVDQICFSKNYYPRFPEITITDPSVADPVPAITFRDDTVQFINELNFTLRRTYTIVVNTGDSVVVDTTSRLITVEDRGNQPPPPVCLPDTFLGCNPDPGDFPKPLTSSGDLLIRHTDDTTFTDCQGQINREQISASLVRTYVAINSCGLADTCQQIISWKVDTEPPVIQSLPLDTTLCIFDPYLDTIEFRDIEVTDNCGLAEVRLSELGRDTVAGGDTIIISRVVTAVDSCENESSQTQIIRLVQTGLSTCPPPPDTCPADTALGCASPADAPPPLTGPNIVSLTADTFFTNCAGGNAPPLVDWEIQRTYIFDNGQDRDTCTQTIRGRDDNVPPDLSALPQDTLLCPLDPYLDTPNFPFLEISDNCGVAQVDYNEISRVSSPNGDTILLTREVTATDSCDNSASATQQLRIVLAKDFVQCPIVCPPDTFLGCNPPVIPPPLPDTVNGVLVELQEEVSQTDCEGNPADPGINVEIRRKYIFRLGNLVDSCEQSIRFKNDILDPDITAIPADTILCVLDPYLDSIPFIEPEITDNCGIAEVILETIDSVPVNVADTLYIKTRWITAVDSCGNTSSTTQSIKIVGEESTLCFDECPKDTTLGCTSAAEVPPALTDADFVSDLIDFEEVVATSGCDVSVNRLYTLVTDGGDTIRCPQTISYRDSSLTTFQIDSCQTLVLFRDGQPGIQVIPPLTSDQVAVNGACGRVTYLVVSTDSTEERTVVISEGEDPFLRRSTTVQEFFRSIEVRDECGRADTCIQKITLFDANILPRERPIVCNPASPPEALDQDSLDSEIRINSSSFVESSEGCLFRRTFTYDITVSEVLDTIVNEVLTWRVDTLAPIFGSVPDTLFFEGPDPPAPILDSIPVTDNCGAVDLIFQDSIFSLGCNQTQVVRTLIATDSCANRSSVRQLLICRGCEPVVPSLADTITCEGEALTLNPNPISGYTYIWSPQEVVSDPALASPQFVGDSTTTMEVLVSRVPGNAACDTLIEFTVEVVPLVDVMIEGDAIVPGCDAGVYTFVANANPAAPLAWSDDPNFTNILGRGDTFSPFVTEDITYFVTAEVGSCSDTASVSFDLVKIDAELPDSFFICERQEVPNTPVEVVNNDPAQDLMLEWLIDPDQIRDQNGLTTFFDTSALNQDLPVMVNNQFGCLDTLGTYLKLIGLPERVRLFLQTDSGRVPAPESIVLNPGETVEVEVEGCATCELAEWSPTTGLDDSDPLNPVITAGSEDITYTFTAGEGDCRYAQAIQVIVSDACDPISYWFPNSFFPEGDTEVNRTFKVMSNFTDQILEYDFAIYNRWGERVFETNDPNQGWDGIFRGEESDGGVYGYIARIICTDGTSLGEFQGNVTLIR